MTSTAFQEGPHFQDIEIHKGAYNLYTLQNREIIKVSNTVEIYSLKLSIMIYHSVPSVLMLEHYSIDIQLWHEMFVDQNWY